MSLCWISYLLRIFVCLCLCMWFVFFFKQKKAYEIAACLVCFFLSKRAKYKLQLGVGEEELYISNHWGGGGRGVSVTE